MSEPVPTEAAAGDDREWRYRMKDLCERTGLGRQAIHFYIQRGLLPPGRKTGRNMAYYGEAHVERLLLIRKLQHERFLPLKAIKAILDDQQGAFSPTQRPFLRSVKRNLTEDVLGAPRPPVAAGALLARAGVSRKAFERMKELELLSSFRGEDGVERVRAEDAWLVETWGEIQRLGFLEDLGFTVDDLQLYDEVVSTLFQRETVLIASRISELAPDRAAGMVTKVLPVLEALISGLHRTKIRDFLASLDDGVDDEVDR